MVLSNGRKDQLQAYNRIATWIDQETGVEYLIVENYEKINIHGTSGGIAITPRLNSDGSIMVKDPDQAK